MHALIERLVGRTRGIGELYVYDTALRIGAWLELFPGKVYLHAGTRWGARALGFDPKARALEVSELPQELQQLEPYEIEDLLCIFKDKLAGVRTETRRRRPVRSEEVCA